MGEVIYIFYKIWVGNPVERYHLRDLALEWKILSSCILKKYSVRVWAAFIFLLTDCLDNVGSSTFHNPIGLHGLLQE
jgi:hypothetical protein